MKAEIRERLDGNSGYGGRAATHTLVLTPETDEEKNILLRLHHNVLAQEDPHVRCTIGANKIGYLEEAIPLSIFTGIRFERHFVGK